MSEKVSSNTDVQRAGVLLYQFFTIKGLDPTSINERENCMQEPGNTAEDCP